MCTINTSIIVLVYIYIHHRHGTAFEHYIQPFPRTPSLPHSLTCVLVCFIVAGSRSTLPPVMWGVYVCVYLGTPVVLVVFVEDIEYDALSYSQHDVAQKDKTERRP